MYNLSDKETNKRLVEEYPFLQPRDIWTDEIPKDYDYEYTLLDELDAGWRKAFGESLLKELKEILVKGNCLNTYRVDQIKEKYSTLRWYDHGYSEDVADEIYKLLSKYEDLSAFVCIDCGKPATQVTQDYICPYCDECVVKHSRTKEKLPSPQECHQKWLQKEESSEVKALYKKLFGIEL